MNEKLTIQDLTDLLAAKHSMTKKDAEAFVREFFLLIEQALESDKTVKIKGLGTFKLVDVDSRESVNVNTGERFQIKGHTKVTFSPDASLRDTINKPFAHFETVVLNENTILEDTPIEEADEEDTDEEIQAPAGEVLTPTVEIQTPVVEIQVPAVEEKEEEPQKNVEQQPKEQPLTETNEEKKVEQEELQKEVEKDLDLELKEKEEEEKEIPVAEQRQQPEQLAKEEEKITAEQIIKQELQKANLKPELSKKELEQKESTKKESAKEKSPVPYLITVIILVLLLCGSVVLFIYYPDLFSSSADDSTLEMPSVTTQPIQTGTQLSDTIEHKDTVKEVAPDIPVATIPQPVAKKEEVNTPAKNTPATPAKNTPAKTENEVDKKQSSTSVYLDSVPYKITGTKTKYTIKEGETLTKVSLRFYGTKAMWPYIVKHNPKVIKNPDNVAYGTTIEIPELTKE